ncbi:MAG: M23 family metallopeptidase [Mariprofundales bacterium]
MAGFKHFSLIIMPERGQVRRFNVAIWVFTLSIIFLLSLLLFGGWGSWQSYNALQKQQAWSNAENQWRQTKINNIQEIARLHMQAEMDKQKLSVYARNIGQLQARFARLDSLGGRLASESGVNIAEFDLSAEPAYGGPRAISTQEISSSWLGNSLQGLDTGLKSMNTHLAAIDYLLEHKRRQQTAKPHAWPTNGGYISSHYGKRVDPFTGRRSNHKGIDIANRYGAPVIASSQGIIVFAGRKTGYGYLIEIEHGYGYRTRYAHLSRVQVQVGDMVKDGDLIGRVGSSGRSTGPHLHYEVYINKQQLNPEHFLPHNG